MLGERRAGEYMRRIVVASVTVTILVVAVIFGGGVLAQVQPDPLSASPSSLVVAKGARVTFTLENGSSVDLAIGTSVVTAKGSPMAGTIDGPTNLPGGGRAEYGVSLTEALPAEGASVVVVATSPALPLGAVERIKLSGPLAPKPAVEAWAVRHVWFGSSSGDRLPLTGECDTALKDAPVAVVQAEGTAVEVTATCETVGKAVDLRRPSLPWVGRTYKGKMKLPGTDQSVDLTVASTTAWYVVLGLLAIGAAPALAVASWRDRQRGVAQLKKKLNEVRAQVQPAQREYTRRAGAHVLPPLVQNWTIEEGVHGQLSALEASLAADTSVANQATVKAGLEALATKIAAWPPLADALQGLQASLERLPVLKKYTASIRARTFERSVSVELPLKSLEEVAAASAEATALARTWPTEPIAQTSALADRLPPNFRARKDFKSLDDRFADAADVASATSARDAFWDVAAAVRRATGVPSESGGRFAQPEDGDQAAGAGATGAEAATAQAAAEAQEIAVRIAVVDHAVLFFLLAVALLAGLDALYVGKTFGGWWDVLKALAWGASAATLGTVVVSALGNAGQSLRDLRPRRP